MSDSFAPSLAAAQARIAAARPAAYARTRNALDGAVTGLSPYVTHGFVTLTDVLAVVDARHMLDMQHKSSSNLAGAPTFATSGNTAAMAC